MQQERVHEIRLTAMETIFHYASKHPSVTHKLRDALPTEHSPDIIYWVDQLDLLLPDSPY